MSLIGNPLGNKSLVETWLDRSDVSFMERCTSAEVLASLSRFVILDNPEPEVAIELVGTGLSEIFEVYDANARAENWQPLVAEAPFMDAIKLARVILDVMQTPDGKPDEEAKEYFNESFEAAATVHGIELNLIAAS